MEYTCKQTAEASDHITSMLKDVFSHKKMEIGSLNEAVTREAGGSAI